LISGSGTTTTGRISCSNCRTWEAWLTDVLTRLPTTRNRDIDSLLPIEGWAAVTG
jgi:hypothetical protein